MNIFADYAYLWPVGFQDPASDWMLAIIELHDQIIFYLLIILSIVLWFLISSLLNPDHMTHLHHGNLIEIIWTATPAFILWAIGLPSVNLLYMMDEIMDAELSVKILGNQWFWSYEYSDYMNPLNDSSAKFDLISFDSFLVALTDLEIGEHRNLNVDQFLVLPVNTSIRLLISSNDVIHSFALPSLAIKCDAIPGRLNSTGLIINRPSTFYGQCSELCGTLHGFMPIGVKAVTIDEYINFITSNAN